MIAPRQPLDREIFKRWMLAFADKLARPLSGTTQAFYYAELCDRLTTAQFIAGARVLFGRALFNQFPGPQEIVDAALAGGNALAAVRDTARLIAAGQPDYTPDAHDDARDDFGVNWRRALAHCQPEPQGVNKALALLAQPLDASPWRYASGAPTLTDCRPIRLPVVHERAAPRPALTPLADLIPAALAEFAPPDDTDADLA